jgi:flagellar motor component MotA
MLKDIFNLNNRGLFFTDSDESDYAPLEEIIDKFIMYAEGARREGVLSVEQYLNDEPNDFLKLGMQLVVDGSEPELIEEILSNIIIMTRDYGIDLLKKLIIIRGCKLIQDGSNPRIVETVLHSYLGIDRIAWMKPKDKITSSEEN